MREKRVCRKEGGGVSPEGVGETIRTAASVFAGANHRAEVIEGEVPLDVGGADLDVREEGGRGKREVDGFGLEDGFPVEEEVLSSLGGRT